MTAWRALATVLADPRHRRPRHRRAGGDRVSRVAAERARGARGVPSRARSSSGRARRSRSISCAPARRGAVGGHPAQPGRGDARERRPADLPRARPPTSSACSSSWPAARSACARARRLEVRARDGFWRPDPRGRPHDREPAGHLDFTPPTLEVLASTRYLSQGGGGLVALRAKGAARVGVKVGDLFFPGFPAGAPDTGLHAALYALPWNLARRTPITASAQDEAGNAVSRALRWTPPAASSRWTPSRLASKFLASKMPELLPERGPIPPDQQLAAFLVVNRDKRKEAEEMKRKLAQKSKPRRSSRARSSSRATPRCSRTSRRRAPIATRARTSTPRCTWATTWRRSRTARCPPPMPGVVVYAAPLNIYGNAVVVDHGWGCRRSTATSRPSR